MTVQAEPRGILGLSTDEQFPLATSEEEKLPRVNLVKAEIHLRSAGLILKSIKYK